jgi:hypothetical protein
MAGSERSRVIYMRTAKMIPRQRFTPPILSDLTTERKAGTGAIWIGAAAVIGYFLLRAFRG